MRKRYHGRCHCGAVTFECTLDLAEGLRVCNCSFCRRTRMLKTFTPREEMTILTGMDRLVSYRADGSGWPEGDVDHYFCGRCGIRPFSRGYLEDFMGHFYCVNAACLDDVPDADFVAAPVIYENGRDDDFFNPPAETRHL
ncbi:GFA family protein [Rhizobium sp. TRM95111]|uniref:GFA family protein n=1 Tax=Rhizobium alarense TaxID=2846851 RepID=UPI001F35C177|nr:GFA family protein [Rhizobium alarense]MCF3641907.1 GFA family protein [Rhizobium alarense]